MEKCLHRSKATFKTVKNQILKGADPERAVRRGYENACDYFELMNKRIFIQHRALACLSKSLAHILQRELYTMGNTGLLRRKAEMTLLQPHLGDSRHQELRNSPFWPTPLFKSQLVKDEEDFLLEKGFSDSRGMGVIDRQSRRLPSHPHPPKLKEVSKVLPQVAGVPVRFPSLRTGHGPSGFYNDCKRSETDGPVKGNQTSPVPRRPADQGPVSRRSKSEHSDSGGPDSVLRVDNKSGEVRTKTNSGVFLRGLQIPSRFSPCKTHSREMAQTSGFDPMNQVKTCFDCKIFDVANWVACLKRKDGPRGMPSHEAISVSPQGTLEISSVIGHPPSMDRNHFSTPRMVAKYRKHDERFRPSSQRPQCPTLYRHLT